MLKTEKLLSRITVNPKVMLGKPTIRGMRITVEQILRALSGGVSEQELLEEYPELEKEDFQAVFAYVTGLVEEEQVFPVGKWEYTNEQKVMKIAQFIASADRHIPFRIDTYLPIQGLPWRKAETSESGLHP